MPDGFVLADRGNAGQSSVFTNVHRGTDAISPSVAGQYQHLLFPARTVVRSRGVRRMMHNRSDPAVFETDLPQAAKTLLSLPLLVQLIDKRVFEGLLGLCQETVGCFVFLEDRITVPIVVRHVLTIERHFIDRRRRDTA